MEALAGQAPSPPPLLSSRPCSLATQKATLVSVASHFSSHNFSPPLLVNCFLLHDCQGRPSRFDFRRGDACWSPLLPSPLVLPPPASPHTPLPIKQLLTLLTFPSLDASQEDLSSKWSLSGLSPPQEGPTPTESTISWQ